MNGSNDVTRGPGSARRGRRLAAVILLVLAGVVGTLLLRSGNRDMPVPSQGPGASTPVVAGTRALPSAPAAAERARLGLPDEDPHPQDPGPAPPARPGDLGHVRIQVLDTGGRPLEGTIVRWKGTSGVAAVGEGGWAELAPPLTPRTVELVQSPGAPLRALLRTVVVRPDGRAGAGFVVAAPAIRLGGTVRWSDGSPAVGLAVAVQRWAPVTAAPLPSFPRSLEGTQEVTYRATTDENGAFRWDCVPLQDSGVLLVWADEVEPVEVELPREDRLDLEVLLDAPPREPAITVRGLLRLPNGDPAVGGRVAYASARATSDAAGRFALEIPTSAFSDEQAAEYAGRVLVAGLAGFAPARIDAFDEVLRAAAPAAPSDLELWLGEGLAIAGRVVDGSGEAAADWSVRLLDPTPIGWDAYPLATLEGLAGRTEVRTGMDGAFRIDGLPARSYHLVALNPRTLELVEAPAPIPAGTRDLVLAAEPEAVLLTLAGTVLRWSGEPAVEVEVFVERTLEGPLSETLRGSTTATTDAAGHFELRRVPREGVQLRLEGTGLVPYVRAGTAARPLEARMTFTLRARCRLRIDLVTEDVASYQVHLLGPAGEAVGLFPPPPMDRFVRYRWGVEPGVRAEFSYGEEARTLVLTRNGEELLRRALHPDPAVPEVIRIVLP